MKNYFLYLTFATILHANFLSAISKEHDMQFSHNTNIVSKVRTIMRATWYGLTTLLGALTLEAITQSFDSTTITKKTLFAESILRASIISLECCVGAYSYYLFNKFKKNS